MPGSRDIQNIKSIQQFQPMEQQSLSYIWTLIMIIMIIAMVIKIIITMVIIMITFRDWVVEKGLYNYPTTCKEPERLSDKMWDIISSTEFACKVFMMMMMMMMARMPVLMMMRVKMLMMSRTWWPWLAPTCYLQPKVDISKGFGQRLIFKIYKLWDKSDLPNLGKIKYDNLSFPAGDWGVEGDNLQSTRVQRYIELLHHR